MPQLSLSDFIAEAAACPIAALQSEDPWIVIRDIEALLGMALATLSADDYIRDYDVARHRTARIEDGAIIKGPAIIGPGCFIAAGAYLRGGVWLQRDCIIGPACEVKSTLIFAGSKLAHFNFVGDSILGSAVNVEAGAILANYRNERDDKAIRLHHRESVIETGIDKFGALLGDGVRIGANAVTAPGTVLTPGTVVGRLTLIDQDSR